MEVRREMKQYYSQHLQDSRISRFVFSLEDQKSLEWDDPDEFTFRNNMYDVIDRKSAGDKTIIYCVQDEKETALIHDFLKHVNKSGPLKGKTRALTQLLSWHCVLTEKNAAASPVDPLPPHYSHRNYFFPDICVDIIKPPPRHRA